MLRNSFLKWAAIASFLLLALVFSSRELWAFSKNAPKRSASTMIIGGTVFEDINYGGGAGRDFSAANTSAQSSGWNSLDIGIQNVRVELYDASGAYVDVAFSNVNGEYQFSSLAAGGYQVRFVTRSMASNRGSNSSGSTAYAVPVFRADGLSTYPGEVGGVDPSKEDALANTTSSNISSLNTATTVAQSVSSIVLTTTDVLNVDFGVSFNVVSNTNNSGIGSVRQFIINSNELDNVNIDLEDAPVGRPMLAKPAGVDVSIFEIPNLGPHSVGLTSVLPGIEDSYTHLSGYTQMGSLQDLPENRTISVRLYLASGSFDGVLVEASNVSVSGFAIGGFQEAISTNRTGESNAYIWGNFIGVQLDGVTVETNTGTGIYIYQHTDAIVGTNGDGVNDFAEGNVVTNSYEGINIRSSTGATLSGNYVGIDATGQTDSGNRYYGILIRDCPGRNVIGLDDQNSVITAGNARNVVGGNGTDGIRLLGSTGQVIAGNYFGLDRLGTSAIGNDGYGLQFIGVVNATQVGTNSNALRDEEERNIISGNGTGVRTVVGSSGADNWFANNYIGTDHTGDIALPNSTHGIVLDGTFTNTVVGTNADGFRDEFELNVISGNEDDGIRIGTSNGNMISGNHIGVGADPTVSVPNEGRGVFITSTATNTVVGVSKSFANTDYTVVGNVIRNNGDSGVGISGSGTNNLVSQNYFGNNGALAIDLQYDLLSVNDDGDGDTGANNLLNYPVITSTSVNATTLVVEGFAPAGVTVEFYIADTGDNPSPLPSGFTASFGEGSQFLLEAVEGGVGDSDATIGTYSDDGSGVVTVKTQRRFSFSIPIASIPATLIPTNELTAISIDASGNTSEFGARASIDFDEICSDFIDNDGDGLVDCEDQECPNVPPIGRISN